MFIDEIAGYNKHYSSHVKRIAFRSLRTKIAKEEPYLNIQEVHGNFDLMFGKDGRLLETIHFDSNNQFNVTYVYSKKRLIKAIKLIKANNEIQEITDFRYDETGRITREDWHSYVGVISEGGDSELRTHSYKKNTETLHIKSSFDDIEAFFYKTFNDQHLLIEEKATRAADDLIDWSRFEYGPNEQLVREVSLDEDGNEDGVYHFFDYLSGQQTGYKFESKELKYVKEYVYVFNEGGHWINRILLHNGEPSYSYERKIEYY